MKLRRGIMLYVMYVCFALFSYGLTYLMFGWEKENFLEIFVSLTVMFSTYVGLVAFRAAWITRTVFRG